MICGNDPAHVLYVGRDERFSGALARALERAVPGTELTTERSPEEPLDRLDAGRLDVDCVLAEYRMPGTNGLELLEAFRATHPEVPFVLLVEDDDESVLREALAAEVTDCVRKRRGSAQSELLVNRIQNAVEGYRAARRAARRDQVNEVVREIHQASFRTTGQAELETEICEAVTTLDSSREAVIFGVGDESTGINGRKCYDGGRRYLDGLGLDNPADDDGRPSPFDRSLRDREIVILDSVGDDPRFGDDDPFADRGVDSLGVVPLVCDTELYGLLSVFGSGGDGLEREYLADIGDAAARALRVRELSIRERAIDEAPIGIIVTDATREDNPITYANEGFETVTGYSAEEVRGRNCRFLQGPDTREAAVDRLRTAIDEAYPATVELRNYRKDGSLFWNRVSVAPLRDRRGEVTHYVGFQRDVTDRKRRKRELERSERKYRTMVEAAPDPILVVDESGAIVEANPAAAELLATPRSELLGCEFSAFFPEEACEQVRSVLDDGHGTKRHRTEDPITVTTDDGQSTPVSMYLNAVELGNRTIVHGVFRDETKRLRNERTLTALHTTARELPETETDHGIARTMIDAAVSILDLSAAAVYFYDPDDGVLRPVAYSSDIGSVIGDPPVFEGGESIAWETYVLGEKAIYDDVRTAENTYNPDTNIRSELFIPLGEHGLFIAGDTREGAFDDRTVELTEILAANTEAALDRAEREESLRARGNELRRENERLETFQRVGESAVRLAEGLMAAGTREEIDQVICESLVDVDHFGFVWVGRPDITDDELVPTAWSGQNDGYLDTVDLHLDDDPIEREPSIRATMSRESAHVSDVSDEVTGCEWKRNALLRDYRSIVSVPVEYNDVHYGTVTVYSKTPDAFEGNLRWILSHLGRLAGYAIDHVDKRMALLDDRVTELEFRIHDAHDFLYRLARRLDCRIEVLNVTPRPGGTYLIHVAVSKDDRDDFECAAEESLLVDSVSRISEEDGTLHVVASEAGLAGEVMDLGGIVRSVEMAGDGGTLTVQLPENIKTRTFVRQLRKRADVELRSQRDDVARGDRQGTPTPFLDRLTDRQREILEAAYIGGYFDRPRKKTGSEIAESLNISQPAFSTHIQRIERTLVRTIFEE